MMSTNAGSMPFLSSTTAVAVVVPAPWRDDIPNHLVVLLRDLQQLLRAVGVWGSHPERESHHVREQQLVGSMQDTAASVALKPEPFVVMFAFLKSRVELKIEQLRRDAEELFRTTLEGMRVATQLLAIVQAWDGCTAVDDVASSPLSPGNRGVGCGFDVILPSVMEGLENVIVQVENALVVICGEGQSILHLKNGTLGRLVHSACCVGKQTLGVLGDFYRNNIFTTTLRTMGLLCALLTALAMAMLLMDLNALGDVGLKASGGSNKSPNDKNGAAEAVARCSIRVFLSFAQIVLTLVMQFLLRSRATTTHCQFGSVKEFEVPLSDAFVPTKIEIESACVVDNMSNVKASFPLKVGAFQSGNGAPPGVSKQQQEAEEKCHGCGNHADGCGSVQDGKSSVTSMCGSLCCQLVMLELQSSQDDVPAGLSLASLNLEESTHEMARQSHPVGGNASCGSDGEDCFWRPQCVQAEREMATLLADAPSGIADKFNDLSQLLHLDRTAKICRHLVENVQDCVCPLIVVECIHQPMTAPSRRKLAVSGSYSYPVVFGNVAGLELLHYRWMTDIVGKDLRSLFGLYRPAKQTTGKKRLASGQKGSTLPALPQAQSRSSSSRLFIAPAPPLKQQRQQERCQVRRRRFEEIADPRLLFENGVEDIITVVSVHESMCFDVYAMSIDHVALPSSFCDAEPLPMPQSSTKSSLVLLFLRQVFGALEGVSQPMPSGVGQTNATPRSSQLHKNSNGNDAGLWGMVYRHTSAVTSLSTDPLRLSNASTAEGRSFGTGPRLSLTNQWNRSTREGVMSAGRLEQHSTTKRYCSLVSAERGHVVDQVKAQQLLQKLESLAAVRSVEVSTRVPESFLLNFGALMIFLHRVLQWYKSVHCRVDVENMYILLEVSSVDDDTMKCRSSQCDGARPSSPLQEIVRCDSIGRRGPPVEAGVSALLSPSLLDYLRVCDASIHPTTNGYTLRFPYTTQERLALMENVGTLQLSTVKGLSLFGVAATNALTEEASVGMNGKTILLHQYAAAEEAFSVAMRKAVHSSQTDNSGNVSLIMKSEAPQKGDEGCGGSNAMIKNMCFFAPPVSQPIDEVAGSSLDSMCGLPFVLGGSTLRMLEAPGNIVRADVPMAATATIAAMAPAGNELNLTSDAPPMMSSDLQRIWGGTGSDNVLGAARARSVSDAMVDSTSPNNPSLESITSHGKRYLHVFLYMKEPRPDVVQYLWARGHSATVVSDPVVMKRYLLVGMHVFDVVFVEWTEKIVTPEIRELVAVDAGKQSTYLYLLNENTYGLPLPPGTPDEAVLRMRDISDIFTDPSIGRSVSLYIRQRRLRHEMLQIRWRKSYQIVRQIGGGAFGDVYEVYIFVSRGSLAMKRLFLNGASSRVLEQLNREALIMSQLDHPNIVSFSHSSMEDNAYCIFMELCDGTLSQRLQNGTALSHKNGRAKRRVVDQQSPLPRLSTTAPFRTSLVSSNSTASSTEADGAPRLEPLTAREVVLLLRDVASGIAYLHSQGIVHRDIKPCNILFRNCVAKIGDFGTAAEDRAAKPLINMKGTLAYMSPEVLLGEPYGKPCDMWSFGCLVADVIGLRLGHVQGLHVPALIELYKSIPLTQSLPITVSNYKGGGLQSHYGDSKARMILGAMKNACTERPEPSPSPPPQWHGINSFSHREKSATSPYDDSEDVPFRSSTSCDSTRAVAYISMSSTAFLGSEKAELPESLVNLLERLFHRDPQKRMTAKEVLDHPATWDVEWMEMVMRAVREICPLEEEMTTDASHCGNSASGNCDKMDLSITST